MATKLVIALALFAGVSPSAFGKASSGPIVTPPPAPWPYNGPRSCPPGFGLAYDYLGMRTECEAVRPPESSGGGGA